MKRRFWLRRTTLVVLAVGIPVAVASHVVSQRIVEADEKRLLEHEATLSSFTFGTLAAQIEASMESAGAVALVSDDDPEAFSRVAETPGLQFFSGLGLFRHDADGSWRLAVSSGETRTELDNLPGALVQRFDAAETAALDIIGFIGTGTTRTLAVSVKGRDDVPYVVYGELPLPEGVGLGGADNESVERTDYAIYIGRETPDRLIFANTDDLPIDGQRASVTVTNNAGVAPDVTTGSAPGEAVAEDGQVLLVTAARGHLVGDLAANFPWFLLATTIGLFLTAAGTVEAVLRRRDHALRLVDDLELKNADLDSALERRREAEEALRSSEERFRSLVAGSPDMLLAIDVGSREIAVLNRDDFFGHPIAALQSEGVMQDLVHPDDVTTVEHLSETLMAGRGPEIVEGEYRLRTAEGEWEWVRVRTKILEREPDGLPARLLAVFTLITAERKAAEEREHLAEQLRQAQRLEAVGQLAGGIAHDFNNLLAVILSYAGFALDELEGHPVRDDIEEISQAARRAAELTSQLLTFSRRQVVEPTLLDVSTIVDGAERILERALGETIQLSVKRDLPLPVVEADAGELEQVLMNLAVNARDAMTPDGGRLAIVIDHVALDAPLAELDPGRYVRLSVSDTGSGMDAETASRAFEPFFTTKDPGEGTGMGLATVYGIAKRWGGGVTLYSEADLGTTVRVYLPAADSDAAPVETTEPGREHRIGQRETVFLVEDEEGVRRAAKRILEAGGYQVVDAATGAQALTAVEIDQVDVLLTDVIMPGGVSGRDLADALSERHPDLAVVYMSGYTADVIAHQGVLDPGVIIVEKPFSAEALLEAVGRSIETRDRVRTG